MINEVKDRVKRFRRAFALARRHKGGLRRKLAFMKYAMLAMKHGVVDFRVDRVADLYVHDRFDFKGTTIEQKKWAYEHGYASYRMMPWYGVTRENYRDYMSDWDFYSPGSYVKPDEIATLFDHKLNTYYLLSPFKTAIPRHYYYVYGGKIMPLDVDKQSYATADDVLALVDRREIAAKTCTGGHGIGFYKFESRDGAYLANGEPKTRDEMTKLISGFNDYIITDYVRPHSMFRRMFGEDSFVVMRTVTVFDPDDGPQLACNVVRIGCKAAGLTTDYAGTIHCGLTLDDGKSFKPRYRLADDDWMPCEKHPDTGAELAGFTMPNYERLKELVLAVSRHVPVARYLVMDIVPTDDGFSILEINSHGQLRPVDPFHPAALNPYLRKVFGVKR